MRYQQLRYTSSINVYRSMWKALATWCVNLQPPVNRSQALTPDLVDRYLAQRAHRAASQETLTPRYAWRLHRLVQRVQQRSQQVPDARPMSVARLVGPEERSESQRPGHLDVNQCRRLLRAIASMHGASRRRPPPRWQSLRDICAAALQLGAGLGPAELRALRLDDVRSGPVLSPSEWLRPWQDTPRHLRPDARPSEAPPPPELPWQLEIAASGDTPAHAVPIARWAAVVLADWLARRTAEAIPGPWLLPSTRSGKPWGKVAQYEAARRVLREAAVDADAAGGSFRLRHTFAVRQLRRGFPPEVVAEWLGVRDPAVIERYRPLLDERAN